MKISRKRKRQWIGFGVGLFVTTATYTILSLPSNDDMLSLGPMNTGHEDLTCESCHTPAKGNVFQQAQANLLFSIGLRSKEADFGTENVDTEKCLECHDRDNDRHPLHRFKEPRFSAARKDLGHEGQVECESCHKEHNGVRVTQTNIGYCQNCHEETVLNNDPLEISHEELIDRGMWETCLQCHDFHGNHIFHAAESMNDTIPVAIVREYFEGGETPYSEIKKYYPLTEEDWNSGMRGAKK
ncbi:cytochrome c3 family protein [Marinoscillum sp. MHG1-6]|uniref:cytochrome c3 family protein n=1 Tax=Marinoscillum sp. MHG1-6 TaxID=2959627 RepID=UPI0021586E8A|nr:cytochrome c3 family protein [Marinoscillum sp. MHG1-6]